MRCVCAESLRSSPTLCDPMDRSLPGSSIHRILQARILEWIATSFSRGSSQHRDQGSSQGLPHCRETLYCLRLERSGVKMWVLGTSPTAQW